MYPIGMTLFKFDPSDLQGLNICFVVQLVVGLCFITKIKDECYNLKDYVR